MSEAEGDLLHEVKEAYWLEFSKLVAASLSQVLPVLRPALLAMLQDVSSVYGSCYEDFLEKP